MRKGRVGLRQDRQLDEIPVVDANSIRCGSWIVDARIQGIHDVQGWTAAYLRYWQKNDEARHHGFEERPHYESDCVHEAIILHEELTGLRCWATQKNLLNLCILAAVPQCL